MFDTEYLEFQVQVQVQTEKTNLEAIKALGIAFILFVAGVFSINPAFILFVAGVFSIDPKQALGYLDHRTFIWYLGTITALLVCRLIFLSFKK